MYDDPDDDADLEPRSFTQRTSLLDQLADRLGVMPSSIIVGLVAVMAAVGGAYWALRPPTPPPVEDTLAQISDAPIPGATLAPTTTTEPPPLIVHVDGSVAAPGLHELVPGARVFDAVAAAGGFVTDADQSRVNLAATVHDGERVWIPSVDEDQPPSVVAGTGGGSGGSAGEPGESLGAPVNVNTASAGELESLPGIGPALAAAIIEYRERSGPFREPSSLTNVPGIGEAKLSQFVDRVVV